MDTITSYRALLRNLIEQEQLRLQLDTRSMLSLMKCSSGLPDFYRAPAQAAAKDICGAMEDLYPDGELMRILQEAMKAEYGAWMRERHREV